MFNRYLLFTSLSCLIHFGSFAQCTSNRYTDTIYHQVQKTTQIFYGTADNNLGISQDLYLDFYEPKNDTLLYRPLIVYAFGGAFLIGDKNQPPIPTYCEHFAKAGYAVASIDYRIGFNTVSTGSCERAVVRAIQDLRAALRFLCQRANIYRIDTSAIFLTGSSAGCIAGIHSSYARESDLPASYHGILLEPSDLGCIDCSGNNDFNKHVPKTRGILNHWGAIMDTSFITALPEDNVPMISLHGDADVIVPYNSGAPFGYPVFPVVYGSNPMHKRLKNIGIKNELVTLVGYIHEPWLLSFEVLDTAFRREKPFMYSILKPQPQKFTGDTIICLNESEEYTLLLRDRSKYCFSVSGGGTILSQTQNKITIKWTNTGTFYIHGRELSLNEVNGDEVVYKVQVVARPKANFGVKENVITVSFTDSSTNATTWEYRFGDGTKAFTPSPTHGYSAPGTYSTTLIVSNNYCFDTTSKSFSIDTCPTVNFSYTISGDSIHFFGNLSNGVSFVWNFGDGTKDSVNLNPVHAYANSQNYLVGLIITNAHACTKSGSQIIPFHKTTGIDNTRNEYPNIDVTISHIYINNCSDCQYQLLDLQGRNIQKGTVDGHSEIDTEHLSKGTYIIRLNKANFQASKLFIIN
jgi:hypothetical protein